MSTGPLLSAEQALLGAVLLDPRRLDHLTWLRPGDFDRPVHTALFDAARTLARTSPPPPGFPPVRWLSDVLAEATTHVRGLDAPYLHVLMGACPQPEHAPFYGRMVLEGAIHRTVLQHAVRLDDHLTDLREVLRRTDELTRALDDAARRWGVRTRPSSPSTAVPDTPVPVSDDPVADERDLLAVLLDDATALAQVPWLTAEDFTVPEHGVLFRCVSALVHRGEPVDRITVLWEARRRGPAADPALGRRLDAVAQGPAAGDADWLGEQILRTSLTRAASSTAQRIKTAAGDPSYTPGRLIRLAHQALAPTEAVRARWHTAHTGQPPPTAPDRVRVTGPERTAAALSRSPHPSSGAPGETSPAVRHRPEATPRPSR